VADLLKHEVVKSDKYQIYYVILLELDSIPYNMGKNILQELEICYNIIYKFIMNRYRIPVN
jgi:hypothetical protein